MNNEISRKMEIKMPVPATICRRFSGTQDIKLVNILLAIEARKRIGPTKINTNRIDKPRRFQTERLRLLFQILCRVCVNVKKIVEADQINPMEATKDMGPRARMMSSKFFPNKSPKAGAKNSN